MRSRRRIIAGSVLAALTACGGGAESRREMTTDGKPATPAPAPSAPDERPAILFLGTSLTAGLGLEPDSAFPALIQRKLDSAGFRYTVVNAGVSGESSAGALQRIDWLLTRPPDILVIETGANDGLRGQPPDSIAGNIQALLDRVRTGAPGTRIALVAMEAMPNLGREYTRRFRAIYPALARRNGLVLLPFLLEGVAGVDSLNQPDGVHPNSAGSRRVAATLWRGLLPLLGDPPGRR